MRDRPPLLLAGIAFALGASLAAGAMRDRRGLPFVTDEFAYLLQADTFARLRLSLPQPPLPEFFEAPQILVLPRYMAKYPPANALALAPFAALGAAWLWPILAYGLCCAAIAWLLAGAGCSSLVAGFGAALFAASKLNLALCPTYLSHCTSTLLALLAIGSAVGARRTRAMGPAIVFGCCAGLAFLTRPFTALALAAPAVLLGRGQLLAALLPVAAAGGLLLAYDAGTTGSATMTGWQLYALQYAPSDGPGLHTPPPRPPLRALPPHVRPMLEEYERSRRAYTWETLPRWARHKLDGLLEFLPAKALALLTPLALVGGTELGAAAALHLVALFALQLAFHAAAPQYHVDEYAGLCLLAALGLARALRGAPLAVLGALLAAQIGLYGYLYEGDSAAGALLSFAAAAALLAWLGRARGRELLRSHGTPALAAAMAAFAVASLPGQARVAQQAWRSSLPARLGYARAIEELGKRRALVFVRGPAGRLLDLPLINPGLGVSDPPAIVAADRGVENRALARLLPDRQAVILDAASAAVVPLGPP